MSKAWFITGASSGIGLGLARFAAHLRRNPNGDAVNNALLNKLEIDSPLKPGTPVRSGLQSNSQRYRYVPFGGDGMRTLRKPYATISINEYAR